MDPSRYDRIRQLQRELNEALHDINAIESRMGEESLNVEHDEMMRTARAQTTDDLQSASIGTRAVTPMAVESAIVPRGVTRQDLAQSVMSTNTRRNYERWEYAAAQSCLLMLRQQQQELVRQQAEEERVVQREVDHLAFDCGQLAC